MPVMSLVLLKEVVVLVVGLESLQMVSLLGVLALVEDHVWFEDRWMDASWCDE
jgi:hypothetical protein